MRKLLFHLIAGILVLYLTNLFIPGVKVEGEFNQMLKTLLIAGVVLGLANFFLKPMVDLITLPLRVLTFGLFGLIINILMVWLVDILFPELVIAGFWPLFWTGLLTWFFNLIVAKKT